MIDYKEKAREFLEMQGWTRGIVDGMTPLVALLESTAKNAEAEAVAGFSNCTTTDVTHPLPVLPKPE